MAWAPDYVTLAELREYATRDGSVTDDAFLSLAVTAASRAIDVDAGRQFGSVAAEARTYEARPDYNTGYWTVDVDDFQTAAGLVVSIDGTAVTTFDKAPKNAAAEGKPWTRLQFTANSQVLPTVPPYEVVVTAAWGWTAVPAAVKNATLLQAHRFVVRRQAPFGIAGSPDQGSELRLLQRVDPDVHVILNAYRRPRSPA